MGKLKFDLKSALNGAEVRTRDGRKVTEIRVVDITAPYSASNVDEYAGEEYKQGLLADIENKNGKSTYPFYHSGESHKYGLETDADLTTEF